MFRGLGQSGELRMCLYLCDMLASLSGVCLGQVMLPDGHPDVPGGLDTRGGGHHVSGGQDAPATHVETVTCHRRKPGKLARLCGPEELYIGIMKQGLLYRILLAKQEF